MLFLIKEETFISCEEIERQHDIILEIRSRSDELKARGIRTFFVHSFGCQQNAADSEKIVGMLIEMGFEGAKEASDADIVFFNTCAVRENAELRVFGNVGQLKKAKAENPNMIIALCGCMTQQEHIAEKIKKSYPFVDLVIGTHALHKIPEMLKKILETKKRIFDFAEHDGFIAEGLPVKREGSIKAWLPIMYGCDNFCSYCIVPYVRGRERSRTSEAIINEAKQLVKEGYKEITLLGQNVNSYGKGLEEDITFSELLRRINAIDGDFRIRFMTSHPKDATKELIDTIAECDKVCKNLHLPVQSGSNRILKEMNRRYTVESYLSLIDYAKEKIPSISFSSDLIVGFPGETREEFLETCELIKKVRYDLLYTFVYSKRSGTKAAAMDDPISEKEKGLWLRELLDIQSKITEERFSELVGTTQRILVESLGKHNGTLVGRTDTNIITEFEGDESLIGQFVDVKITKAFNWAVVGERI